jgi:hypothetical protein
MAFAQIKKRKIDKTASMRKECIFNSALLQERWTAVHETSKEWVARMTTLGKKTTTVFVLFTA